MYSDRNDRKAEKVWERDTVREWERNRERGEIGRGESEIYIYRESEIYIYRENEIDKESEIVREKLSIRRWKMIISK